MTVNNSGQSYAGDISVTDAWDLLKSDPAAQIVDVRTAAEWNYVGLPDTSDANKSLFTIEWQSFPTGAVNQVFADQAAAELRSAGVSADTPILFLCRSGARSRAAAIALTRAGYTKAYNIAGGFEGDVDGEGHRGKKNGWKAAGLPWRQG